MDDKVVHVPVTPEPQPRELTTEDILKIVRKVRSVDGRGFQILLVAFTALITWFTASGLVYKDFPKQSEVKELSDGLQRKIEELDRHRAEQIDRIQKENIDSVMQLRNEQKESIKNLNDSLEDLKMQFVKLQAEITTKEKYDKRQ